MELLRTEITGRVVAAAVDTHDRRMTHFTDRTVEIVDGRLQQQSRV
jgi:ABC-type lipoprotein export system ATPase subunit